MSAELQAELIEALGYAMASYACLLRDGVLQEDDKRAMEKVRTALAKVRKEGIHEGT